MKFRILKRHIQLFSHFYRGLCARSKRIVLGIETSCDDTGAAVIDEDGNILGESLKSQMKVHLENGGVIPHIAVYLHEESIEDVVSTALTKSNVKLQDLSAIAVTTKPGLRGSLKVGVKYAKYLASTCGKPLIPIHHMEAHALTARLIENIEFPFLTLLASGGHCQIALVKSLEEFLLLGTSSHNSPGEVLDKVARRLKLQNLPECYEMSGGQAIEFMAKDGDPLAYNFPYSLTHHRDCNFSFSGFTSFAIKTIETEEEEYDVPPDGVVPTAKNICASLLHGYALHMMHRIHRAFIFCEIKNLLSSNKRSLVFSGGVACNTYIRTALKNMCAALNAEFYCPPPRLCTDNGIMIAWNGVEKLKAGVDICSNFESIKPDPDCPLGTDLSEEVRKASIKVKMPKIDLQVEKEKVSAA